LIAAKSAAQLFKFTIYEAHKNLTPLTSKGNKMPEPATPEDEAQFAINYSHLMTEVVCLLIADMQAAGVLRPMTKQKILDSLQSGKDHHRAWDALDRLAERLKTTSFREDETKRQAQKRLD
jgi:hypothetical protein